MTSPWIFTGQSVPRRKQPVGTAATEHPARDFKLIRCSHHGSHVSSRSSLTGSSRSEYEQPREGTRTPISDVIHCSTGHRIMLHWARGDEGPPQRSINNGIPIRRCSYQDQERPPPVPRPSHINSNRDYTIKQGPSLHQTHWFTQIQLAGGSPTTWSAQTRSPTISHDMVGPYTISHDLP